MLELLFQGHITLFIMILFALLFSLTFHEFGHAITAYGFGDDTAARMGRLSLNPLVHIDWFGLLLVVLIGFGFAKPVPVDSRRFRHRSASFWVALAGPMMNFLLAIISANLLAYGVAHGWYGFETQGVQTFLTFIALINLLLGLFNLLPIGALDGHYIAEYLLPPPLNRHYSRLNHQYGNLFFMVLIVLSILGVPIFSFLWQFARHLLGYLIWV